MRRLILGTVLAAPLLLAPVAVRAEEKKSDAAEEHSGLKAWEWANFVILAGGIGYIIGKNAGPAFEARGRRIRKAMLEAEEAKSEADARAADVDRRLANLGEAIASLRADAQREDETQNARYARNIAAEIAKIQAYAGQEIAAAGKAARTDLKRYAAEIALGLAEQKIRGRMTPDTEDHLVRGFVKSLDSPPSGERAS
jgi:F-type H+-transporting ATPase subunit b